MAPALLQACGLPSSSGSARQPPRPQRPLPGFSLPFKPHTVLLMTSPPRPRANHRPRVQAAGPPAAWPRLQSTTPVPTARLLTAPGIRSKPFRLPPETPAVWLPGSLLLHPPARQPFQTHFPVTKSMPQEPDVTSHGKGNPALWGGAAPPLPTKRVGKPPSPWQLICAFLVLLPTLLFGVRTLPQGSAGLA